MIERLLAAEAALERDDLEQAHRLFGQVADADPRNAIAVTGLARIAIARGDRGAARELAGQALEIDRDEEAAIRLLAELDHDGGDGLVAAPDPALAAEPVAVAVPGPWWRRWLVRLRRRG